MNREFSSRPLPRSRNSDPGSLDPLHDVGYGVKRSEDYDSIIFARPLPRGGKGFEGILATNHVASDARAREGISQGLRAGTARHRKACRKPN
jgi:hypothetical protein